MTEAEEDVIYDEGYEAAVHVWGRYNFPPCPYPEDSEEAEIWWKGLYHGMENDT